MPITAPPIAPAFASLQEAVADAPNGAAQIVTSIEVVVAELPARSLIACRRGRVQQDTFVYGGRSDGRSFKPRRGEHGRRASCVESAERSAESVATHQ
ncbi:MAG: hypothetical protein ABR929_12570 [Roseiarcus sp.]|jgi:hypothetical protein